MNLRWAHMIDVFFLDECDEVHDFERPLNT